MRGDIIPIPLLQAVIISTSLVLLLGVSMALFQLIQLFLPDRIEAKVEFYRQRAVIPLLGVPAVAMIFSLSALAFYGLGRLMWDLLWL